MNDTVKQIQALKKEKNALILAHYYTPAEVQEIADYVGDSYYLAKVATQTDTDVVVFCGVAFMGESVKILNPKKTVIMPDMNADCAMAHMASVEKIKAMRERYDDLAVVCYINSTAELKCHSDVCVTSSNAVKIVRALPNQNVYFIPDENLGRFVAKQVPEKNVILNDGCCPIHASINAKQVTDVKQKHPNALVLSHPECRADILALSDYIGSTADIIKFADASDADEFVICTEDGVGYPLQTSNPKKKFYFPGGQICCRDMKLNTLDKVLHVLQTGENEIFIDDKTLTKAIQPLNRMLTIVG